MATKRTNPYAAFNFVVSWTGPLAPSSSGGSSSSSSSGSSSGSSGSSNATIGAFMEASGLDGENAIIEYREGADQSQASSGTGTGTATGAYVRKQPGLERYPNVVLRRGICGDLTLWTMRQAIRDATGGPEFATSLGPNTPSLKIDLQDETHKAVVSWTLQNVWVSKLSGPTLNAKANEIAVESVEFVCERITLS